MVQNQWGCVYNKRGCSNERRNPTVVAVMIAEICILEQQPESGVHLEKHMLKVQPLQTWVFLSSAQQTNRSKNHLDCIMSQDAWPTALMLWLRRYHLTYEAYIGHMICMDAILFQLTSPSDVV